MKRPILSPTTNYVLSLQGTCDLYFPVTKSHKLHTMHLKDYDNVSLVHLQIVSYN